MAFKKLIWHFYVAVAFHRLPRSGRVLSALHCSNSLRAPSSSPERACTGLARERESVGGAPLFLPRGAGAAAGRGRPRGRAGGAGGGERPESPAAAAARDSPAGPEKDKESSSPNLPRHPQASAADLSLLLNGALLEHTSPGVTSPPSLLPCPWHPLVKRAIRFLPLAFLPRPRITDSWRGWL